jgi:hypothetical protein
MNKYNEYADTLISNNNSISNTPVKPPKFGMGHLNNNNTNNGNGVTFRNNHYNLTSPFKPVKPDGYEIE